jgi:hypothetical protein
LHTRVPYDQLGHFLFWQISRRWVLCENSR